VSPQRAPSINLVRMEEELSAVHLRLAHVVIENLPWLEFLKRYDRKETFFYLDPPYYNKPVYKYNFTSLSMYEELSNALRSVKGTFILSINDHKDIRQAFKGFIIKPVTVPYSVSRGHYLQGKELLIEKG